MFWLYQGPTLEGVSVSYCHNDAAPQTAEILPLLFQATAVKETLQSSKPYGFFGFPVSVKVMFTLYLVY